MTPIVDATAKLLRASKDMAFRTKQGQWTIAGTGLGAVAGLATMGSIGVASGLGAFALPGILLLAVPGLIIGNRIGVELEKHDLKRRAERAVAETNGR